MSVLFLLLLSTISLASVSATEDDGSEVVVAQYLRSLAHAMGTKDRKKLETLFAHTFRFEGCTRLVDREETVNSLLGTPTNGTLGFRRDSSKYTNDGRLVMFRATTLGVGNGIRVKYILKMKHDHSVLLFGKIENCEDQ